MIPRRRAILLAGSLVLVLGAAIAAPVLLKTPRAGRAPVPNTPAGSRLVNIEVGGMECAACVTKITGTLSAVRGVTSVEVSLERQRARVVCASGVADTALTAAVRRAGPDYIGLILRK
jgi:copper chaperone CopZ